MSIKNKYRKKPFIVDAVQWLGDNFQEICEEFNSPTESCNIVWNLEKSSLFIPTLEGTMEAKVGDWIIRGIVGEVYPCKNDVFLATYDKL